MQQLWVPEWQPRRRSREFLERCLRTTAGGQFQKTHYLALALYAATRAGVVDEGEFIIRNEVLRGMLEHSARGDTLRRKLVALEREALIEISRAGRARRYRVFARPDDRIVLAPGTSRVTEAGLVNAVEAAKVSYALSRAVTGHWKPKTLLMALGALWRVAANDRGTMRFRRSDLQTALEWNHHGRLDKAKRELQVAGYIDWVRVGHEIEMSLCVDVHGRPVGRGHGNRVTIEVGPIAPAETPPEPETKRSDQGDEGRLEIGVAPKAAEPEAPEAPEALDGPVPRMTDRQLRTLAGILRDLYQIPLGKPVEEIGLAALPEDLAAEVNRRRTGPKPPAGASGELKLETIPADIGAELIRRLGGPARTRDQRRRRTRWLREQARHATSQGSGEETEDRSEPARPEPQAAQDDTRRERAEQTARELGYVPTDNPRQPWVRREQAGLLGYRLVDGRAIKRGRDDSPKSD